MSHRIAGETFAAGEVFVPSDGQMYGVVFRVVPNPGDDGSDYGWLEPTTREEVEKILSVAAAAGSSVHLGVIRPF